MIRGISFLSEAAEDDDDVIIVWLFYGEGNGANIIAVSMRCCEKGSRGTQILVEHIFAIILISNHYFIAMLFLRA